MLRLGGAVVQLVSLKFPAMNLAGAISRVVNVCSALRSTESAFSGCDGTGTTVIVWTRVVVELSSSMVSPLAFSKIS